MLTSEQKDARQNRDSRSPGSGYAQFADDEFPSEDRSGSGSSGRQEEDTQLPGRPRGSAWGGTRGPQAPPDSGPRDRLLPAAQRRLPSSPESPD